MHNYGGFEANDIIPAADHIIPPAIADILSKLSAEGTVIPKAVEAAVDLGGLENESPAFAQGNNLLHEFGGFSVSHKGKSVLKGDREVKEAAAAVEG